MSELSPEMQMHAEVMSVLRQMLEIMKAMEAILDAMQRRS
jgi:hypothetical protein